jgi:prepilin-type N-terminal cleavage/methylation domain-containing protein
MAKKRGFTLIELLLVVVLISALLSFSLPRFKKAYENLRFQNFTGEIYYLARSLQAKAISERKVCCAAIEGTPEEFRPGCDETQRRYRLPPGVRLRIEPEGAKEVCFYPDGSIDSLKLTFKDESSGREVALVMTKDAGSIQIQ